MKQTERILQYMRDFGSITQLEAIRDISCMRLGARIFDLKREGYAIKKETETSKNRYGEDTSYARYRLVDDER
nr:MAG TPA: helix-turn-helix domain protein [Caudoviricetes sp.]